MPSLTRAVAAVLACCLLGGCRHVPWGGRALPACPGPLVSTLDIPGDFLWRYQVQIDSDGDVGDAAFQLVVQKRGDELVLVGIHALGAELFSVRQIGTRVDVEALPPQALPIPPENVLRDVHRLRFAASAATPEIAWDADGKGAEIRHPGCGYRARFRLLEERDLP